LNRCRALQGRDTRAGIARRRGESLSNRRRVFSERHTDREQIIRRSDGWEILRDGERNNSPAKRVLAASFHRSTPARGHLAIVNRSRGTLGEAVSASVSPSPNAVESPPVFPMSARSRQSYAGQVERERDRHVVSDLQFTAVRRA